MPCEHLSEVYLRNRKVALAICDHYEKKKEACKTPSISIQIPSSPFERNECRCVGPGRSDERRDEPFEEAAHTGLSVHLRGAV